MLENIAPCDRKSPIIIFSLFKFLYSCYLIWRQYFASKCLKEQKAQRKITFLYKNLNTEKVVSILFVKGDKQSRTDVDLN